MLAVEVGGSSTQAVYLDTSNHGVVVPLENHLYEPWLLAAPGLVEGNRVRGAHHLGWMDIQASEELGMASPPLLSMNDAEAAALGEWVLRGCPNDTMLYISMGTGVGAVVIRLGKIVPVEFGHLTSFGPHRCGGCGRLGCLDAQIGGHALPTPLEPDDIEAIVTTLEAAIQQQDISFDRIVIGAGLSQRYPQIVSQLSSRIGESVEPSLGPKHFKSAAPIGLWRAWERRGR
jgi:hypothetical protein